MARSRNIKPGFFINDLLLDLDFATRLLFAGLWTVADREGRLEDRPKKVKIGVFPSDDVDVDAMLKSLHEAGFIVRYEVGGVGYIQITNWKKHQNPHNTEKLSVIPDINGEVTVKAPCDNGEVTVTAQDQDGGNPADSGFLIPDSGFPEKKSRKARTTPPRREISLAEYLDQCQAEGRMPIPPDHAIRGYCKDAGIPDDMLQVAWLVFKDSHLNDPTAKKYIDWPATFAKSVKGCWYRLWYTNQEGHADWSTRGLQERRVIEARMATAQAHAQQGENQHAPA